MEFNENDFRALVENMAKQNQLMELFYKGWTDYTNNKLKYGANVQDTSTKGESMKNISKRKDNRYIIRKVINGQRVYKYAKTLQEAKTTLKQIKKESQLNLPSSHWTFGQFTEHWFEVYRKPFVTTRSAYEIKRSMNKILKTFKNKYLNDITTSEIQMFLNNMPKTRTKEKTENYFNAILQKAVDLQLINRNPFRLVIREKKLKTKNEAYNIEEQSKILEIVKNTDIEHEIMSYLMCGCRPNELPKKNQFDFEYNLINIYGTKNENALHREIEMSKQFAEYIKEYFKNKDIQDEKYISRRFNELCNKAGINKPLLYRLRHTFATNHFTIGTQPKIVQHWLGHSKISITLDTYTDIDKKATKEKILSLYNNFYYIKS